MQLRERRMKDDRNMTAEGKKKKKDEEDEGKERERERAIISGRIYREMTSGFFPLLVLSEKTDKGQSEMDGGRGRGGGRINDGGSGGEEASDGGAERGY